MLVETHVHSIHSPDGYDSIPAICEAAILRGVDVLTITDHCDMNAWGAAGVAAMPRSIEEAKAARARYAGRVEVLIGIELGQPLQSQDLGARALALCDYDFVIGAVHNNPDGRWYRYHPGEPPDLPVLLCDYFEHLLAHARWGGFDSLAHLTYPYRYLVGEQGFAIDERRYDDLIDAIFKALIEQGIALELNASGLFQPYGKTMPHERLLRRYRERGGELITIGSDAHRARHVGRGIKEAGTLASHVGFRHAFYYKNRQPIPIPLG